MREEKLIAELEAKERDQDHHLEWTLIVIGFFIFLLLTAVCYLLGELLSRAYAHEEDGRKKIFRFIVGVGSIVILIFVISIIFCLGRWLSFREECWALNKELREVVLDLVKSKEREREREREKRR